MSIYTVLNASQTLSKDIFTHYNCNNVVILHAFMYFTNVVMIMKSTSFVLVLNAEKSGASCYKKLKWKTMRKNPRKSRVANRDR